MQHRPALLPGLSKQQFNLSPCLFRAGIRSPPLVAMGMGAGILRGGGAQHLVFESLLHSNVVTLVRAGAGVSVPEAEKSALPESRRGGRGDI